MTITRSLLFPVFLALLALPAITLGADSRRMQAAGRITAVTVYPDRALTTRTATLTLAPGSYVAVFDNLPAIIQDDSVRVEGQGSAQVTIMGLEVKRQFLEKSGEKRVKELDEEIRALERRLASLDAKRSGLTAQKLFIESIRVAWGDRISKELAIGRPTTAELLDASSFVGAGIGKLEEQAWDIEYEKKPLKEKIDALKRQRDETAGSRKKESKTVEVAVEVARGGNLTLVLSGVMPNAGWEPLYDARLAADGTSAELTFRALVRQQTGEEWNDVDLTLSTARPSAGGAPPELQPWRIALYRPMPVPQPMAMAAPSPAPYPARKAKAARPPGGGDGFAESAPNAEEPVPASYLTAQMSSEQTSVAFRIPRKVDIPSDGAQHSNVVAIETLPVKLEFLAIPKLSPFVFLKSEIVNRADYPLLPGKVNIFTGNTFSGASHLKKVAAGEKFDLFFGSDDQVTVKREELKQHKEAGMFGKNRASYRYRVELNNFRREGQTVTLRDQLPLAGDEEIKVSLEEASVKPDEIKNDGTLVWKLPLKAGEKRELTFGILVEYPKDKEITGL